jgi:hypothetical protein
MKKNPFFGKWRIVEMEHWDSDQIDLVVPGHITFEKDDLGKFQFGTVRGELDCRVEKREGPRIEFSWEGETENDPACGRGWAVIKEGELHGRLYIHLGDDSWFRAVRE